MNKLELGQNQITPEEINRNFADRLTPEAKEAYLRVNEPEEAGLIERGKLNAGESLLGSTLELIKTKLRQRFGSDGIFNDFLKDEAEIAEIKERLIKNSSGKKGDQREIVVEEIIRRLTKQSAGHNPAR